MAISAAASTFDTHHQLPCCSRTHTSSPLPRARVSGPPYTRSPICSDAQGIATGLRDIDLLLPQQVHKRTKQARWEAVVRRGGGKEKIPMAERWKEYHGCNEWRGLLEPLDEHMRGEILKYGDMAQLTYDAFNLQTRRCDVAEEDLLKGLRRGYRVTKYIYAKPEVHLIPEWLRNWRHKEGQDSSSGCWMGFVAVTEDEAEVEKIGRRDIVVAWRGTVTRQEWLEDMDGALVRGPEGGSRSRAADGSAAHVSKTASQVGVERGFWTLYSSGGHDSARSQVVAEVRRLVSESNGRPLSVTVTGHSLGGALALLCAYDLAPSISAVAPVSVISFAAPRVGNDAFKRRLHEELGVNVLRVVNAHDVVPKVPGIMAHEEDEEEGEKPTWADKVDRLLHAAHAGYTHVGTTLHVDNRHSPFLKDSANLADTHNLEVYLHLLDAYRSKEEPFVGAVRRSAAAIIQHLLQLSTAVLSRDIALVNKTSDLLLDELRVPPFWWNQRRSRRRRPTTTIHPPPPSV